MALPTETARLLCAMHDDKSETSFRALTTDPVKWPFSKPVSRKAVIVESLRRGELSKYVAAEYLLS